MHEQEKYPRRKAIRSCGPGWICVSIVNKKKKRAWFVKLFPPDMLCVHSHFSPLYLLSLFSMSHKLGYENSTTQNDSGNKKERLTLMHCAHWNSFHETQISPGLCFFVLSKFSAGLNWYGSILVCRAENSKSPDVMTGFFSLFLSYAQFWRPLSWRRTQTNLIYTRASY